MYGAKGGEVYVMGNAAGRPLINAVGRPKVVINGTALDFLAESFMAGDVFKDGGFVIVNGMEFDERGRVRRSQSHTPAPISFRWPPAAPSISGTLYGMVGSDQLNGGEFTPFTEADWQLIKPYLEENERLFGIRVEKDLLTVDGELRAPEEVYRKVQPLKLAVLSKIEEAWE